MSVTKNRACFFRAFKIFFMPETNYSNFLQHDNFSIELNCGKSLLFIAVGYSNIEEGQMYFVFQEGIQSLLVKLNQ